MWATGAFYAAATSLTDWPSGVNYGFFRAKPCHTTLYDWLSPWPAYIPKPWRSP